jgi:hypothetical protein
MVHIPIRRSQLIAPFGPGAMSVTKEGVSVICAGLEHWYKNVYGTYDDTDIEQFKVKEWRLEKVLNVDHFRLPPDFRKKEQTKENSLNLYLTVPFLRFPQWHFCRFCGRLEKFKLHDSSTRLSCPSCQVKGYKNYMVQVPYVAMCEHGHIQDFPWREWVHRTGKPKCKKSMYLKSTGGSSLSSMRVECECGAKRSLFGITSIESDRTTYLSKYLDEENKDAVFTCQGKTPWLGTEKSQPCSNHLLATLRNASNVYFAKIKSALYIPGDISKEVNELIEQFHNEDFASFLSLLDMVPDLTIEDKVERLKRQFRIDLRPFTNEQIKEAIIKRNNEITEENIEIEESIENQLRIEEYHVLNHETDQHNLKIKSTNINDYAPIVSKYFSNILLVEKLKETRVLTGFTRVINENGLGTEELKALLRAERPNVSEENWLPAYEVYGEGIFLKLNEELLKEWELQPVVQDRIKPLQEKYQKLLREGRSEEKGIAPRFVLIHTLSHLLINQLTFECGYSTAALRERLYVSTSKDHEMCGLLIYTAAGDSDGTMGGLVKMGKHGYLESILKKAIENARWCSADPICMEIGSQGGQGPDSCNLAACHNCGLVPETACEEFNRFLDRALVVGNFNNEKIGFFNM